MESLQNSNRKWWTLLSIGIGTFMTALDTSVVNTVLPVIGKTFQSQVASVEWVVTVYLLGLSALLLSFGRLGDMRGHKLIYILGLWISSKCAHPGYLPGDAGGWSGDAGSQFTGNPNQEFPG
jgi:MFS family permease